MKKETERGLNFVRIQKVMNYQKSDNFTPWQDSMKPKFIFMWSSRLQNEGCVRVLPFGAAFRAVYGVVHLEKILTLITLMAFDLKSSHREVRYSVNCY